MRVRLLALMATIIPLFMVGGCNRPGAKLSDEMVKNLFADLPGITSKCLETVRFGGFEALPPKTDQCFKMERRRRWRGAWRIGFEENSFCPAPEVNCDAGRDNRAILTFQGKTVRSASSNYSRLYSIEFVGRKTRYKGGSGQFIAHEIVVDRVIALTIIDRTVR